MYKGLQKLSLRLNVKLKAKLVTYVTNLALNFKSGQKRHFNYSKASIMNFSLFEIKLKSLKTTPKALFSQMYSFLKRTFLTNFQEMLKS